MDLLNDMIGMLSKEEVRNTKIWLNSTNATGDRKDIMLFDYIRKSGENYSDEVIYKKLYRGVDKNSFYRLKNRLLEDVSQHLAMLHFHKYETNNLYLWLSLHNLFLLRNKPSIALYFLKKGEKRATAAENFELLDIIYAGYIKLSAELTEINPEKYIELRRINAAKLNRIRETDQTLAAITYRLKLTQNYGKRETGLLKLLDNTIREFAKDDSISNSRGFQLRMFRAVSQVLIQNHNFVELEKYSLATYNRFESEKWFDKSNHEVKLQMLVYIINSLFKNRKYNESLSYAETLGEEMSAFNNQYYDKYLFFYYNSLVINYAQTDFTRGLRALDEMEREIKGIKNPYYEFFILLNKSSLLFFQKKYNEAIRCIVRLQANDHYKKADAALRMKIAVAECIMHYESKDETVTQKRVEQVRKQFSEQILADASRREKFVIDLISNTASPDRIINDKKWLKSVTKFIHAPIKDSIEDGEILKYRVWLSEKMNSLSK